MKTVFMGTPDFSVPCLNSLIDAGHTVAAVFTQPDKPKGRGYVMTPPPVKVAAQQKGIEVYQPTTLRDNDEMLSVLREIAPDVIVVVAYGKLLPKEILDLPKYGCVNVHASLLPRHRGASPIQWSIVCGDKVTGVSTMQMDIGMDTGDVLEMMETPIDENENCESLHDRLSEMGAELIVSTLAKLEDDSITPIPQSEDGVTRAPIIKKEMGRLDFSRSAKELHDLVRGFNPWPAAYFMLGKKRLKVFKTALCDISGSPGEVLDSSNKLVIACGNGAIELIEVQLEGAKRMTADKLLMGHPIEQGVIIE